MNPYTNAQQESEWQLLYDQILEVLRQFGEENPYGHGDYWVLDDNWGIQQHKVELHSLQLPRPDAVKMLQTLLLAYPEWDIMIGMDIPGKETWPPMGLIICDNEIIDWSAARVFAATVSEHEVRGKQGWHRS